MTLLRIDASRTAKFGNWIRLTTPGLLFVAILGVFGSVLCILGLMALAESAYIAGLLMTIGPLFVTVLFFKACSLAKHAEIAGNPYSSSRVQPSNYMATVLYNKLNVDNQAIARPLVMKIYDDYEKKDANGELLYYSSCQKRACAVRSLLDEQVAQEKAISDAESRVQRSLANDFSDDISEVMNYIEAMRHTREQFLEKEIS